MIASQAIGRIDAKAIPTYFRYCTFGLSSERAPLYVGVSATEYVIAQAPLALFPRLSEYFPPVGVTTWRAHPWKLWLWLERYSALQGSNARNPQRGVIPL